MMAEFQTVERSNVSRDNLIVTTKEQDNGY